MKKIGNLTKYYEVSVFFLIITDLGKVSIGSFAGLADARVCVRLCLPACPVAPGDGTGVSLEDRTGVLSSKHSERVANFYLQGRQNVPL
ncbi:MAG: hypothetical protein LWX01_10225 [Deltaproteobacteria bacterium]|nr:hypothetical protein [Deltaproteobacteria bacterium]MDL1959864.1 hypothetical protein [Deltaproteobacteria bacterium]MDL1962053.1 hypothetical protein [Deltaproteobacteria bacterium]